MIITDNFVFIHIPKTGGTFVTSILEELHKKTEQNHFDTAKENNADKHSLLGAIPDEECNKPVLICTRDPFDHLISMYEFKWWYEDKDSFFIEAKIKEKFPSYPELTFEEFIYALNDWSLLNVAGWIEKNREILIKNDIGSLTMWYLPAIYYQPMNVVKNIKRFMFGNPYKKVSSKIHIISKENLNNGLYDFLLQMGYEKEDIEFILERDKIRPNSAERKDSKDFYNKYIEKKGFIRDINDYYSDELKNYVLRKERAIFKLFPQYIPYTSLEWRVKRVGYLY